MGVLIPYVTASLIDKGISAGVIGEVWRYGGILIGMALLSLCFGILAGGFAAYSSTGLAANLRDAMYRNIQRFSFSDIDKFSTAGLVTRMTTDVSNIQNAFQMLLRTSFRAPLNMVSALVMCFLINGRLSIIFLIAMVVLMTFLSILISRAARLFKQIFERYDAVNAVVQENVSAIRVVKAFVRENHEISKFDKAALSLFTLNVRAERLMALNHPVMNLVVNACIIAVSWFGARYIKEGALTTGQLTSLFSYIMTIMASLMMLSMIIVQLTQSAASAARIAEVIDEIPDMADPADPLTEVPDGGIVFDHVSFSYKDTRFLDSGLPASARNDKALSSRPRLEEPRGEISGLDWALDDVSFTIGAGETIGVIGGTGSGKSTLGSLISRLYDVSEGSVRVGGNDVREYAMSSLRGAVANVLQKSTLFSGTVLENLRWGKEDATEEECAAACRLAAADEFVREMPEGYNSVLDQGGANLSGGQRQRLCIARALLKDPKVLVLDDATSAADTATDARIREALKKGRPGITTVIISQRILSIRHADRILVLDGGRVIGYDTHDALVESCPVYREIYEMQSSGGEGDFDESQKKEGRL